MNEVTQHKILSVNYMSFSSMQSFGHFQLVSLVLIQVFVCFHQYENDIMQFI